MSKTKEDVRRAVVVDDRRYDVYIMRLDSQGELHIAASVRESFADLIESAGGEREAVAMLAKYEVRPHAKPIEMGIRQDYVVINPPHADHDDAMAMIEKLRLASGLTGKPSSM